MKAFLTTNVFKGIIECEAKETTSPEIIELSTNQPVVGEGKQWHRTLASANLRMETMRKTKIKSLEKQLEKLKKLES